MKSFCMLLILFGCLVIQAGEYRFSLPGDLDNAVNAKFYNGKVQATVFDRNQVWMEKGRFKAKDIRAHKVTFSGNTIDIFQNARNAWIRYELDGKALKVKAPDFQRGVTRIKIPNGKHTFRLLDKVPRVASVCLKEVVQQTAVLTTRKILLPQGAKNLRAVFIGGKVKILRNGQHVFLQAETQGIASDLKLLWDGQGTAKVMPRPQGKAPVVTWLVDNMTKILPAAKIPSKPPQTMEVTGVPGEVISFQVAAASAVPGEYIAVSGESPCGKIRAAAQESVLVPTTANRQGVKQAVAYLPAEIHDLLDTDTHELFLKKGKISAFWLTLTVPKGTPKGNYTARIKVQTSRGCTFLNLKVRILSFRMPDPAEFPAHVGESTFRPGMCAKVFGIPDGSPEYFKMLDELLEILKHSRQTATEFSWDYSLLSMCKAKMDASGKWTFDFTKFDQYYGRVLNAFRSYPNFQMIIPFSIAIRSPKASFRPVPGKKPIYYWKDFNKGIYTDEIKKYYKDFLPALFNHLDRYGARHKIYFRIGDEASRDLLHRYKNGLKIIRDAAPDVHIQDCMNHADTFRILGDLIDRPIPHVYTLHNLVDKIEKRTRSGKICGMYMASSGPIGAWMDMKLAAIRLEPFLAYRYGISYISHYGWNEYENVDTREYPSKNIGAFTTPGDYGKVYLIPERKKVLPTIRLAAIRDSRQDFALLYLLEQLNAKAMKKLGIKGDPAEEGRDLCRQLRDVPDMFQANREDIARVRAILYRLIEERSGKIPVVILKDSASEGNTSVDITVKTLPGRPIRINGQPAPQGKAKVFLSPTKNFVTVEVGNQKFTRYFPVNNDKSKYMESLMHRLRQFSRNIPKELLEFSEKFRLASERDFDKLATQLPEMEKQAEKLYISEHFRCFLKRVHSPELQKVVQRIRTLEKAGNMASAIRLLDMLMLVEPERLYEKQSRLLIYPMERSGEFFWIMRNGQLQAEFNADTMRLVSMKRAGKEFMQKGMVEMFSFDALTDNPKNWKTFPGENGKGQIVLLARRQFNDENILRRVIMSADSDRIFFRTRIQAENLPNWNFNWRTHAWYRGNRVNGVKMSDYKHYSATFPAKPLEITDSHTGNTIRLIPGMGINKIVFWHEHERHTLDLFASGKYTNAIGKVIEVGYDLLPMLKGQKLRDKAVFPGEKITHIDLRKKPQLPFRTHGQVQFTSEGLKLNGKGCIEFKHNPAFEWKLPFKLKIEFSAEKGGVLFKRSRRQGEMYISLTPRNYTWRLIAPSRYTSDPKYIALTTEAPPPGKHTFEMHCDGERVKMLLDGKVCSVQERFGPLDSIGGREGFFVGAYGVEGKAPRHFLSGTIHSVTLSQGTADPTAGKK